MKQKRQFQNSTASIHLPTVSWKRFGIAILHTESVWQRSCVCHLSFQRAKCHGAFTRVINRAFMCQPPLIKQSAMQHAKVRVIEHSVMCLHGAGMCMRVIHSAKPARKEPRQRLEPQNGSEHMHMHMHMHMHTHTCTCTHVAIPFVLVVPCAASRRVAAFSPRHCLVAAFGASMGYAIFSSQIFKRKDLIQKPWPGANQTPFLCVSGTLTAAGKRPPVLLLGSKHRSARCRWPPAPKRCCM